MKCKLCKKFYKKYPLKKVDGELVHVLEKSKQFTSVQSPIICAFNAAGKFDSNNYSCQTMLRLRELCGEGEEIDFCEHADIPMPSSYYARDDLRAGSIGVFGIPELEKNGIQQGYVVMTFYKSRGATGCAIVMWDAEKPEALNLKTAEFILNYYKALDKKS